jgi:hypothetical protein
MIRAAWLPFFACKAVGDVLCQTMQSRPDCDLLVLCGHTHSGGKIAVGKNIRVWTGEAEYGEPVVQEILEIV